VNKSGFITQVQQLSHDRATNPESMDAFIAASVDQLVPVQTSSADLAGVWPRGFLRLPQLAEPIEMPG
jgi:hypothetical protein